MFSTLANERVFTFSKAQLRTYIAYTYTYCMCRPISKTNSSSANSTNGLESFFRRKLMSRVENMVQKYLAGQNYNNDVPTIDTYIIIIGYIFRHFLDRIHHYLPHLYCINVRQATIFFLLHTARLPDGML